jgi:galactofuranosylgalactofuranosylrhamnosyl-N-acetylglucosaminyl-diphospho-decaprenol beta-1,5/1,6-galactofuranosyltransferase
VFDLSLDKFGDGGWLWFDVVAGAEPATVAGAEWSVAASTRRQDGTKLSVAITTLNRPDDCVTQMKRFLSAPSLLERLDQLIITDQGTKPVKEAAGYAATAKSLGSRFRLVEQANLGGSGGFARGMDEGTRNRDSAYVMLLDDDVLVEPESILRAINFADYTRRPTLVGGHMLNLYQRSQIHNLGERVDTYSFTYGPTEGRLDTLDFARHPLRATPLLHERQDVDYNAWWMCLIPRETIEEIGLALPVFIKWDDVEYGLRAKQHGFTTVSLPGVGVWHMPFTQKDDRLDWQAYFHQRNRWISALLYSPYPHGGAVPKQSFATDVKHLVSMQYSSAALRITALEDVLKGPEFLQASIATRLGEIRALQKRFSDSRVIKRVADYPPVQRLRPLQKGTEPGAPQNRYQFLRMALSAALRQFHGADGQSREFPEERVTAFDARWWRLAHYDSALVSSSDGAGAAVYRRDSRAFRAMLRRSAQLHLELMRRWDELKTQYRAALPEITSPEEWRKTFEHSDE